MKKIIFLCSRLNGFFEAMLSEFVGIEEEKEISLVYWDSAVGNGNQYISKLLNGVKYYKRSETNGQAIYDLLEKKRPDVIYMSGWMDREYVKAVKKYKENGGRVTVLCGVDDQWRGTLRQFLGSFFYKVCYKKKVFDLMWVAGKQQYYYARKFGHADCEIIYNLLSADLNGFSGNSVVNRRFLFVGRFDRVKGLDVLISAYMRLEKIKKEKWPLVLVGDGELKSEILNMSKKENILVLPYLQPEELIREMDKGGIGCLVSRFEQWGVVIHEYAAAGMPVISSDSCGAAGEFVINGFNGYLIKKENVNALVKAMDFISDKSDEELLKMSEASIALSKRINPKISAYSLWSIVAGGSV